MRSRALVLILAVVCMGCPPATGGSYERVGSTCGPPRESAEPAAWPAGELQGTVNSEDGEPISGARVMVEGTGCAAITSDDGSYHIPRVPVGMHVVVVQVIGYDTLRRPGVEVSEGLTTDIELVLGARSFMIRRP